MINRALYAALKSRFGNVKITNENVRRVEEMRGDKPVVMCHGENYQVNCPLCGDTKGRLSISYMWLEKPPMSTKRRVDLAHCYNEGCPVYHEDFWQPIVEDVQLAKMGMLVTGDHVADHAPARVAVKARLPEGFTPLAELGEGHPAIEFVRKKYNIDPKFLSDAYKVGFTDIVDVSYPQAQDRVIFPIYVNKELVAWQGRTIHADSRLRWYLPPGFIKPVYNADNVPPTEMAIVGEGIPSAIACGATGVAIFGSSITQAQTDKIASTWSSVLIATDPETFVPDNRPGGRGRIIADDMKAKLARVVKNVRSIQWPVEILELARRHNNGETVKVPDPADIGLDGMRRILRRSGCP
jgi:hypothetical protein